VAQSCRSIAVVFRLERKPPAIIEVSMIDICMPAEPDLPAPADLMGSTSPCVLPLLRSLSLRNAEHSRWQTRDFEVHLFRSLENGIRGRWKNALFSQESRSLAEVAEKGEFIMMLSLYHEVLAKLHSYLHLRISSLERLSRSLRLSRHPYTAATLGNTARRSHQKTRQSIAGFVMNMRSHTLHHVVLAPRLCMYHISR